MHRKEILENAILHTCGDRNKQYGEPKDNLENTARLFNAYLISSYNEKDRDLFIPLTAKDIACLLILLKIARTLGPTVSPDTYEDMAAYAAIAGELHD